MASRFNLLFISCLFSLCLQTAFTQNKSEKLLLEWEDNFQVTFEETATKVPKVKGHDFNGNLPSFSFKRKIGGNQFYEISATVLSKIEVSSEELKYLTKIQAEIPAKFTFEAKCTNAKSERYIAFSCLPLIREKDAVFKVTEIQLSLSPKIKPVLHDKDFATESVLNDPSSEWFKIAVKTDGIFKLDKSFLSTCGVDVSTLNPASLNVYGNGEGRLPENNGVKRSDDLVKNAILFVGDGDVIFEDGEYFLFHAWGPHRWDYTGGYFRRDMNIYSDDSFYFIRISASEPALRISQNGSSTNPSDTIVSSYDYFDCYEQDLRNLLSGGQRWYGEDFDLELVKTFTFSTPDFVALEPVRFISSFAVNKNNGANTIAFSHASSTLFSTTLPAAGSDYGRKEVTFSHDNFSGTSLPLTLTVNRNSPSVITYLDKIEINARRNLKYSGQFRFRDLTSVALGNTVKFQLTGLSSSSFIWDVSDKHEPKLIDLQLNGSLGEFTVAADSLREFVLSNGNDFFTPVFVKRVDPQNLHGLAAVDLLIVTHPDFLNEAWRLAQVHATEGMSSHVVTTEQVYNEFSSGALDPTAIKWFAKMFYDRANGDPALMPENLLLFGDGTFDPKNRVSNNNYFVPVYEVLNSEDHINALVTDDYFGLLDDSDGIASDDMMDIGVGRMIVSSAEQAGKMVDKVEQYLREGINSSEVGSCGTSSQACSAFGDWRQKLVQIADDEEGGYFVITDMEPISQGIVSSFPEVNIDKIYLDANQQVTNAGGERYPDVVEAITDRVERGALIVNYIGHGGEVGVAEERVITVPQIQSWSNYCHLNLFVSATCEFTKYDDPARVSAGEWLYLDEDGGAIALATTTRSVFFNVNSDISKKFFENVYVRDASFMPKTFGEIMRLTKNQANSGTNKRSFNLIGDPALRIEMPMYRIVTDSINSFSPALYVDTLEALSKVTIKGHVEDFGGNLLSNFNGFLNPSIFDKPKTTQTLGQNSSSPVISFEQQKNVLYKGKASVTNGKFEFSFIVPKDIRYDYGNGKISFYANSDTADAGGADKRLIVGGLNPNGLNDSQGPTIEMYFNSDEFVDGGLTNESPILIAKLFDKNGINTVGNGIGHDIMAVLDAESANPIVLNDYYNANLDTYQSGEVRYQFQNLSVGQHVLSLKVWDVNNNSSTANLNFEVQEAGNFQLSHVLNYPNPFTTNTNFFFEHNQLCDNLEVLIQVFTVSGKLVKTIREDVFNECFRSDGIAWDGLDDFGDQLARGVYVYKLKVRNSRGEIAEKIEKLVILK